MIADSATLKLTDYPAISGKKKINPKVELVSIGEKEYPRHTAEYWTSRQRQANSIHEVSYRACFKAQLPRFFIEKLTKPGDVVYDPFSGRGTTIIEGAIAGRRIISNDVNPVSEILCRPRLLPPDLTDLQQRLAEINLRRKTRIGIDLSMFYHDDTLRELSALRYYLRARERRGQSDALDNWIRMVATNRLTGHSSGFFSVYTLPPNQAITADRQAMINQKRNQKPPYRDVKALILKKTRSLLKDVTIENRQSLAFASESARFLASDARNTTEIPDASVQLTVTSPPFLDVVQYANDNWLRCWFNHIGTRNIEKKITSCRTIADWSAVMGDVFHELYRITAHGGHVAFEVGEVKSGKVRLEEHVVPLGEQAGFGCVVLLINQQRFTKTSNIWGIANNRKGTNSNRIVVFRKE